MPYLEDGDDFAFMAGAATVAWEILLEMPDTEVIIVPVGGGNLLAATALAASILSPTVSVIGVQSEAAPAVARSFERTEPVSAPCHTFAGGLATSRPSTLAFSVLGQFAKAVLLVTEDDLRREMAASLRRGVLIEGAAAAAFALYRQSGLELRDRRTVLIQTGGNVDVTELRDVLAL